MCACVCLILPYPFAELDGCHDNTIGSASILTVMVECFEEQFRSSGTGEVETHHLWECVWGVCEECV